MSQTAAAYAYLSMMQKDRRQRESCKTKLPAILCALPFCGIIMGIVWINSSQGSLDIYNHDQNLICLNCNHQVIQNSKKLNCCHKYDEYNYWQCITVAQCKQVEQQRKESQEEWIHNSWVLLIISCVIQPFMLVYLGWRMCFLRKFRKNLKKEYEEQFLR